MHANKLPDIRKAVLLKGNQVFTTVSQFVKRINTQNKVI